MASRSRVESNRWLKARCGAVTGRVLSIGAGDDRDGEGGRYRQYFPLAEEYVTSEVVPRPDCDLVLDVRSMPQIRDASFDCIYCSGVLEHVDDPFAAAAELHRILRPGGTLLLGVPFRQAIHLAPTDYWRFTEHGVRSLLQRFGFTVHETAAMDAEPPAFPAAYWVRAARAAGAEPAGEESSRA
jgi:SAM-dependent methyltransferase